MDNIDTSIPINTIVRQSKVDDRYYVAKSGVNFYNWQGIKGFFGGFYISENKEIAIKVSKIEVLERLYALYDLNKQKLNTDKFIKKLSWPDLVHIGTVNPRDVLFGESPFGESNLRDASGLGASKDLISASIHAVFELLERHWLAKIWYEDAFLIQIRPTLEVKENFCLNLYTVDCPNPMPFVVACITSKDSTLFLCGSAVSNKLTDSIHKATMEAYLLLDSFLSGDKGICQSNKERLLSLQKKEFSLLRESFVKKKVRHIIDMDNFEMDNMLIQKLTLGSINNIFICPITEKADFCVVRAISQEALKLPEVRKRYNGHDIPFDPFC